MRVVQEITLYSLIFATGRLNSIAERALYHALSGIPSQPKVYLWIKKIKLCIFGVYVSSYSNVTVIRCASRCELVKALKLVTNVVDNRVLFVLQLLSPLRALSVYPRASETSHACVDIPARSLREFHQVSVSVHCLPYAGRPTLTLPSGLDPDLVSSNLRPRSTTSRRSIPAS